ncbi:arginine--tRNA ligase [Candidatus Gracilibacteria bacterium]|nr:arginine--tRNA ligase [Candidatus Gracilibacteria bacterium]
MENTLKQEILKVIKEKYSISLYDLNLTIPPKKELGDFAFNCGILSRELKKSPAMIADDLLIELKNISLIKNVTNENGFINITLNTDIFTQNFKNIYNSYLNDKNYFNIGAGSKLVVDYIGANVGKPLHIGHMCTPNQGQAMINTYKKLGYDVISDSHIGDWGIIFGKLILAYKLWGDEEKLKENAVDYLLELYVKVTSEIENDNELEQKTRDEFKLLSTGDKDSVELWRKFTSYSIEAMNKNLARLNVKPDYNIGESFYEGLGLPKMEDYPDLQFDMHSIVDELIEKGIAEKNDDNSVGVVFPGDKLPSCILQKRDGTHGYLASDLASIKYRTTNWKPAKIVYFVDVRQQLHFKQAFEIAKNAGWLGNTELFHAYNGFISGKEGAFSTRKGNIIKLSDLLDEAETRAKNIILEKRSDLSDDELNNISKIVGIGAIKYGYLKKNRETDVIFDWDEFMTFEGNSGPYIQYAYVRAIRILENSLETDFSKEIGVNFENSEEFDLIKVLSNYKEVLIETSTKNAPHILCKYAYDLTKSFNSFYNSVHILNETDVEKKYARLKLLNLFLLTIKDSFNLLGIDMPNKM